MLDFLKQQIGFWQCVLFIVGIICVYGWWLWRIYKPYKYKEPKQNQHSKDLERLGQINDEIYNLTCDRDWEKIQELRRERIKILSNPENYNQYAIQRDLIWLSIQKIGDKYFYNSDTNL
jgi:hypothetical protein